MNWFLANPKKLAEAELETCKLALFKAVGSKAWAESMIEYNTQRIKELERFLDTQPEPESTASFATLTDSVANFKKFCEGASVAGFKPAKSVSTDSKGNL